MSKASKNLLRLSGDNIVVQFNRKVLFNIQSLSFSQGDTIFLQGDNGTGKTTLMKVLAGLLKPNYGGIESHGFVKAPFWQINKLIGKAVYLHQHPYVFSGTVLDNLKRCMSASTLAQKHHSQHLTKAIALTRLTALLNEDASKLSGGEKQRLAMARVWLMQPKLLLLDEPIANMDKSSQQLVINMIRQLQLQGTGIIISSHQGDFLTTLCNKHWLLVDNQLTVCSKPRDALVQNNNKSEIALRKLNK